MGLGSPNQVENFMVHTLLLALARRKVRMFHFRPPQPTPSGFKTFEATGCNAQ
jgi:hypothetical protein